MSQIQIALKWYLKDSRCPEDSVEFKILFATGWIIHCLKYSAFGNSGNITAELIPELYETALKYTPDSEDFLTQLFMGYVRIKEYKKQQQVKQHALNCSVNEDTLNVVTYDLSILQYRTPVHASEYLISANLGYFLINFDDLMYCYCTDYLCSADEFNSY